MRIFRIIEFSAFLSCSQISEHVQNSEKSQEQKSPGPEALPLPPSKSSHMIKKKKPT